MLHQKSPSAMTPVVQPSRQLARAYWDNLEVQLIAAMLVAADQQQAAAQKGRAL